MSDCRFGVSPVNYPDPDPVSNDVTRAGNYSAKDVVRKRDSSGTVDGT